MSSKIEHVKTDPIASNAAVKESNLCNGSVMEWRVDVRTAAGAASSNTVTITITDNVFGRTLLTKAGVTGVGNFFDCGAEWMNNACVVQDLYKPFELCNQRFTVTIASGTNTDYVEVWGKIKG
jgi:hypothetical protein